MEDLNKQIALKFDQYPPEAKSALLALRAIILEVAAKEVTGLSESLKWGQPSYAAKRGSPIRIDWSEKNPDQYRLYFICHTSLIATFKELYPDTFHYEGNRAIVFTIGQDIPNQALTHCLSLALNYHKLKHIPLLGG